VFDQARTRQNFRRWSRWQKLSPQKKLTREIRRVSRGRIAGSRSGWLTVH